MAAMSDEPADGTPGVLRTRAHRAVLAQRHADGRHVVAAVLCAQWCTSCREFLPMLESLAARQRGVSWLWVDIEDDADLVGDVDVETFPTLAVYVDATLAHFGPVLPNAALVERLVAGAQPRTAPAAPGDIVRLVQTLLAG
jgi:thioredoxin 1